MLEQQPTVYRPPLKYPKGFMKRLMDSPILLYQLGLGPLIGPYILILTTTGRVSGKPRMTAIEHRRLGVAYYIVSAWGEKADWYRNILKNPHVQLWAGRRRCDALAEVLHDEEKRQALRLRWGSKERKALCALFQLKAEPTEEQMTDLLKNVIIVRLRPFERVEAATTPSQIASLLPFTPESRAISFVLLDECR